MYALDSNYFQRLSGFFLASEEPTNGNEENGSGEEIQTHLFDNEASHAQCIITAEKALSDDQRNHESPK